MDTFKTGDTIEHRLMPGFTMPVLDSRKPAKAAAGTIRSAA